MGKRAWVGVRPPVAEAPVAARLLVRCLGRAQQPTQGRVLTAVQSRLLNVIIKPVRKAIRTVREWVSFSFVPPVKKRAAPQLLAIPPPVSHV